MTLADLKYIPAELIENCDTKEDAIRLCWAMRTRKSMTMTHAAGLMGLSRGQLSKILDGHSGTRGNQERRFQSICGNRAIAQFLIWDMGMGVYGQEPECQVYECR